MSNNLKSLVKSAIAAAMSYQERVAEIAALPEIKQAKRGDAPAKAISALLLPHVAAALGCAVVAKERGEGETLDVNDKNYKRADNALRHLRNAVLRHGAKAEDDTPAKTVRVSRDCMAAVERLLGKYDRKMVLEAIKRIK